MLEHDRLSLMAEKKPLSDEQLHQLMDRYYGGEKVSDLIKEFGLTVGLNNIATLFPKISLDDSPCPYCEAPMVMEAQSRTAVQHGITWATAHCETCGHHAGDYCNCSGCRMIHERQAADTKARKQQILLDFSKGPRNEPVEIESMPVLDALNLAALSRIGRHEDSDRICSLPKLSSTLSCQPATDRQIMEDLLSARYIDVDPKSSIEAVGLFPERKPSVDVGQLKWVLNLGRNEEENLALISELENWLHHLSPIEEPMLTQCIDIWRQLALEELLAYLALKMREHRLEPRFGEKTESVLLRVLEQFPIFKIYNFIWGAVRDSAAYRQRDGVTMRHAANTVIGNCQRRAEHALAEGWVVKDYRRDWRLPLSTRTDIFQNVVTPLGDRFYSEPPSAENFLGKLK